MTSKRVAVIGGGIRGLALAFYLSRAGVETTLIEADDELGGVCRPVRIGNTMTTIFYHVLMPSDRHFFDFLADLGLDDALEKRRMTMGFFHRDEIHPLNTYRDFLGFRPISFWNRLRLVAGMLRVKMIRDWRPYESMRALDFIRDACGRENAEVIWAPLLKAKFGSAVAEINAADIINRINRMTNESDSVKSDHLLCVRGTMRRVIEACEAALVANGVRIVKGRRVKALIDSPQEMTIVLEGEGEIVADRCVATIPLCGVADLLDRGRWADYAARLRRVRYLDNACLILNLSRPLVDCYQLNVSDPSIPITGLIGFSNLYGTEEFGGSHMFYVTNYFPEDNTGDYFDLDEAAALDRYRPHLKRIQPEFDDSWILGMKHIRRRKVEVFHSLGFSRVIPEERSPVPNLVICSCAQIYPKMTVLNVTVRQARDLAERLAGELAAG